MASKRIEDMHTAMLDQMMASSGIVCLRSPVNSDDSIHEEKPEEEERPVIIEEEQLESPSIPEEEKEPSEESIPEETTDVFPTPSLRRVLTDKTRRIEKQNRVYVLPETFKTDINPDHIPRIKYTAPKRYIEILGEITGCTKYSSSLAEYWFLDTLANLLRRAQDENLDKQAQAVLIQWFCQWMREMEYFDAANRERMLRRFKDNMLSAARFVGEESRLPAPLEAGVYHKAFDEEVEHKRNAMLKDYLKKKAESMDDPRMVVSFEGATSYECSLRDLTKILHYIFDLFSTDYQYDLVRSVFTFTPEYCLIDAPYQLQQPRKFYAPLKPAKAAKEKKKETQSPKKKDEKGKKAAAVAKVPDTEEYINLMMLKAYDMQKIAEQEEKDREEWNRRSHILPLSFAATDELFDKYWPPPTPPPPEPEPSPEPVKSKKGQKSGKKK